MTLSEKTALVKVSPMETALLELARRRVTEQSPILNPDGRFVGFGCPGEVETWWEEEVLFEDLRAKLARVSKVQVHRILTSLKDKKRVKAVRGDRLGGRLGICSTKRMEHYRSSSTWYYRAV